VNVVSGNGGEGNGDDESGRERETEAGSRAKYAATTATFSIGDNSLVLLQVNCRITYNKTLYIF
jgi:hypothetical protein